jgi:iron complex transport system ATP-binding protein
VSVVLEARGLDVARGETPVLHGVSLELHAGEALAIVGPNAAGKSTLVRALAGLLAPAAGEVRLEGRPLSSMKARLMATSLVS